MKSKNNKNTSLTPRINSYADILRYESRCMVDPTTRITRVLQTAQQNIGGIDKRVFVAAPIAKLIILIIQRVLLIELTRQIFLLCLRLEHLLNTVHLFLFL